MRKTFKYRIYPTAKQRTILNNTLSECCWLYNQFLEARNTAWKKEEKFLTCYNQAATIPKLKKERPSLTGVHSQVLQNIAIRVDLAFKAFFRRVKAGDKPGYPRFKGMGWYDSFTYPQSGFKFVNNKIFLSKIGHVRIKLHRDIHGTIKTCNIRRRNNKWFVCFSCEVIAEHLEKSDKSIGIDVGLETFATLSNGERIENPRFFKHSQKRLAKAQRKLSKSPKKSTERRKARKIVSHIHEKITNQRNDFCHKVSRKLINRFGIICIEDLNINKMQKGNFRSINRGIGDAAWNQFSQYLTYKAESAGRKLVKVNPAYTSQTCSKCGYRQSKKLSDRIHHCPSCDFKCHRDLNASLNILTLGLQSLDLCPKSPHI